MGLTDDESFEFPITQTEWADASGLTPVHVNRTLQKLRSDKLIEIKGKTIRITDPKRLREVSGFNANYLHLDRVHDDGAVGDRAGELT